MEAKKRYGDDVNNPRRKEVRVALLELRGFVYEMISQERNWCTWTNLKGQQQFFGQKWGREENLKQKLLKRQKQGGNIMTRKGGSCTLPVSM